MMYKFSALALVLAAVANAQLPAVPPCSLQCFTTALTSDGCASITDFACHCGKPQLVSQIQPCIAKACSPQDQATAASVVQQTCQSAGVPIAIPSSGGSSSAPASSAPASSAPASSSKAAASSSAAAVSSSAAPASSSAPAYSSAMSSAYSSMMTTAATSGVAAPTMRPSANATTSVVPFTGDAAKVRGAVGGVVIVGAAVLFAL